MILKNFITGKYEIISNDSLNSYYFKIIYYKYGVNINAPPKKNSLKIREKINKLY